MPPELTDVALIGAGPIGLEIAVALKQAGIEYLHFDAKQLGHTISWFAPQTRFFSSNERIAIAGVPLQTPDQSKCTREQYLAYLRSVVQQFDLQVRTFEPVISIQRERGGFHLTTRSSSGEKQIQAKRIIFATGGTDRPRKLGIPGEDLPHVSHYFGDPHLYFRKRVLIVGGKNSAVEAALRCYQAGAHVAFSYRRPTLPTRSIKYWLLPEMSAFLDSGKIENHLQTIPTRIDAAAVTLAHTCPSFTGPGDAEGPPYVDPTKSPYTKPFDFVLLLVGYEADMRLLELAGVELETAQKCPAFNPATMRTNVPGVYVAGTAIGGTQDKYTVFIENCHVHAERIVAHLTGSKPPEAPKPLAQPES